MLKAMAQRLGVLGYMTQIKSVMTTRQLSDPSTKFVLYSQGRSGSHLLMDLIGSHPNVHCDGSLLGNKVLAPYRYLQFRSRRGGTSTYGFKVKPYHLDKLSIAATAFFEDLERSGWRIIHLVRTNKLRQSLSNIYASAIGTGHVVQSQDIQPVGVEICVDQLMKTVRNRIQIGEVEDKVMSRFAHLRLCYESDLLPQSCHLPTSTRIFYWLDLPEFAATTQLQPSTPKRLSSFVANFTEVETAIRQAGWADFLDNEDSNA